MKLYTFKKTSWHVRFFKWIFDVNPVNRYNTMCPYFWTYVLIMLFLPLILLVKMFGKGGTKFLNYVKDYKANKEKKTIAHLQELCDNPDLKAAEAYKIKKSKCWKKYYWDITNETRMKMDELYDRHRYHLNMLKRQKADAAYERSEARAKQYAEMKEQKWFTPVSYIITFGLLGTLLYALAYVLYQGGKMIDWPWLGEWTLIILGCAAGLGAAVLIVYGFVKYVFAPFIKWISCIKLPECGICSNMKKILSVFKYVWMPIRYILIGIGKFFAIIGDMIYSTYKKKCPIITWED